MVSHTKRCSERSDAIEQGNHTYFTGKPCKNGHIANRRVSDHSCLECRAVVYKTGREEYHEDPLSHAIKGKKVVSKKLGVPFDLVVGDIERPTHCPVLGLELDYTASVKRKPNKASLDRFIPSLGYIKGNVQVISWRANRLKSDGTLEEFIKLIEWMKKQ